MSKKQKDKILKYVSILLVVLIVIVVCIIGVLTVHDKVEQSRLSDVILEQHNSVEPYIPETDPITSGPYAPGKPTDSVFDTTVLRNTPTYTDYLTQGFPDCLDDIEWGENSSVYYGNWDDTKLYVFMSVFKSNGAFSITVESEDISAEDMPYFQESKIDLAKFLKEGE